MRRPPDASVDAPPALRVTGEGVERRFTGAFRIGRDAACDVCLDVRGRVSRNHAEVRPEGDRWWVVDLGSSNGTLVGGVRVERAPVDGELEVQLGTEGPVLRLTVEGAAPRPDAPPLVARVGDGVADTPPEPPAPTGPLGTPDPGASDDEDPLSHSRIIAHYFEETEGPAGERTQIIRRAYGEVKRAQEEEERRTRRRYAMLIGVVLVVAAAVGYAAWREVEARRLRDRAAELFVQLRQFDRRLAEQAALIEEVARAQPEQAARIREQLEATFALRQQTAAAYDRFIEDLGVYNGLSSEEEAIYRTARAFGESELTMPPEFVREVHGYLAQWRRSSRFQVAVRRAQQEGYVPIVVEAMRRNGLPPEFFYLALQESNFDPCAVGPATRWGIAKGAWQFIPSTGEAYGLRIGPRASERVCDPLDERHDFAAAADAAARYLRDIYTKLAQASGLLVVASYNWGEHRVQRNLERLPRGAASPSYARAEAAMRGIAQTPQDRSYWRFLSTYRDRMPDETKGYVMNIFAAAVIGQNPRLFGIEMNNPLTGYLRHRSRGLSPEAAADSLNLEGLPRPLGTDELRRRSR